MNADKAGPPSPPDPYPANLVMMPVLAVTSRTRQFPRSAMYTFPDESTATEEGLASIADVAARSSPLMPYTPGVPATATTVPLYGYTTFAIQLPYVTATYKLPELSMDNARDWERTVLPRFTVLMIPVDISTCLPNDDSEWVKRLDGRESEMEG